MEISQSILDILDAITNLGHEAYLVGGFVRDALLGRETKDVDICTSCSLAQLEQLFPNHISNRDFGSLKIKVLDYSVEITQFREERAYLDQRHPSQVVFGVPLAKDVLRRDFTINGLLYHPQSGLIDLVDGKADLDKRILRVIGDADQRFAEDALRIVRLHRFASELGFDIEEKTKQAAHDRLPDLNKYKPQWLKEELFKYLMGDNFLKVTLEEPQLMCTLIPELNEALNFTQDNPYHRFNLFEHTIRVMAALKPLDLKLVALFHDLGKLKTRTWVNGHARYPHHAQASLSIAKPYLESWQLPKARRDFIQQMILAHDWDLGETKQELANWVVDYGFAFIEALIEFKRSDNQAKSDKAFYQLARCQRLHQDLEAFKALGVMAVTQLALDREALEAIEPKQRRDALKALWVQVLTQEIPNTNDALRKALRRHSA